MPNWLVLPTRIVLLSHIEHTFVFFLFLYLKTMSLSNLKIMKKSPITKYMNFVFIGHCLFVCLSWERVCVYHARVWWMCNWETSHRQTINLLRSSSKWNVLMILFCVVGGGAEDLVTDVTGWFVSSSASFLWMDFRSCCSTHFITKCVGFVYGWENECWSGTRNMPKRIEMH